MHDQVWKLDSIPMGNVCGWIPKGYHIAHGSEVVIGNTLSVMKQVFTVTNQLLGCLTGPGF